MPMPFVGNTVHDLRSGQLGGNNVLDKSGVMTVLGQKFGITSNDRVAQNYGAMSDGSADSVWTPGVGSLDHDAAMKLYNAGVGGISDTMVGRGSHDVTLDKRSGERELLTHYTDRKPTFMDQAVPAVLNMMVSKYAPIVGMVMQWVQKENAKPNFTDKNNPNAYVSALQAQAGSQWGQSQSARTGADPNKAPPVQQNTGVVPPRRSIDPVQGQTPMVPNFGDNALKQRMLMAMLQGGMGGPNGSSRSGGRSGGGSLA